MKPTLLVMAAGMGSRYGGLKQMDAFGPNGETLLHFAVYDAVRAGFGKVVFVIRPEMEETFRDLVCAPFAHVVPVAFAMQTPEAYADGYVNPQRTKPWGTGQAVLAAKPVIDTPFAVINADDFYGADAFAKMAAFLAAPGDDPGRYAMVAYTLRHTLSPHGHVSRGVCSVDADGLLRGVTERLHITKDGDHALYQDGEGGTRPLDGGTPVSMNLWGFQLAFFEVLQQRFLAFLKAHGHETGSEFALPTAVDAQIQEGSARVTVLHTDAHWLGVTYPSDREVVVAGLARAVAEGAYPHRLWDTPA